VENLPRLGSWQDANLEQLVLLEPDLVITGGIDSDAVSRQLADLGIATVAMPVLTLEDIFTSIESIGRAVGRPDRARSVTAETRTALDQLDGRVAGRPRPRVLLVVDRLPGTLRSIYTPTEASFLDELVRIAGGEPVPVTGGLGGYAGVSLEALVHLDPEIVIETIQGVPGRFTEDSMAVWGSLPELAAVRAGRVYAIRDTSVLHPSQRVRETAVRFAELIHPGVFPR
jgi:iron complex transport system substrate-binding protein